VTRVLAAYAPRDLQFDRAGIRSRTCPFSPAARPRNAIDGALKRLEVGLPRAALPLLTLRAALTRGDYLALYRRRANVARRTVGPHGPAAHADRWRHDDSRLHRTRLATPSYLPDLAWM
jgi:hypothetical protein